MKFKIDLKSIETALKFIPALTIVIYFVGYFILNYYLSRYGIYESNILSVEYLRSGLVYLSFLSPLYLSLFLYVSYINRDMASFYKLRFKIDFSYFGIGLVLIPIIVYSTLIGLVDFMGLNTSFKFSLKSYFNISSWYWYSTTIMLIIFLQFLCYVLFRKKYKIAYANTYIVLVFILGYVLAFAKGFDNTAYIKIIAAVHTLAMILFGSLINIMYLSDDENENNKLNPKNPQQLKYSDFSTPLILVAIVFLPFFSTLIYPEVPRSIGGGKPAMKKLLFDSKVDEISLDSMILSKLVTDEVVMIYEGSNKYYLEINEKIIGLNKSIVIGEQIDDYNSSIISKMVRDNRDYYDENYLKKLGVDSMLFDSIYQELIDIYE